ncbi:DsbA family protein [Actinophytocola sp.]|uniref:DsbA family protein n=1 Tax=Actinophytocola sp. TaxID=1872138 RepID=UPI002D7EDFF9|nr:thioredoxin domain-containing protein [Actinophytocola sp.]HET9143306.1 thioredoxin domain-containing protein [Actinophytocola sp.]
MGGAERNARKKRQAQTAAGRTVASARASGTDRTKIIVGLVVVLLIAGAVIGGVLYTNAQKNKTEGQVIQPNSTASAAADYPVRRDGAVVVAGKDGAKVTIDVYEDFLCPFCGRFETTNAAAVERELQNGALQVRYHPVAILNDKSDPAGYSLDAANAALCAAEAGKFPPYHASLFQSQPEEGARGYDNTQLTRLGTDLGITTPDFPTCIQSGTFEQQILEAQDKIKETPHLQQDFGNGNKGFGTPTVTVGETIVDVTDPAWLDKLLAQA